MTKFRTVREEKVIPTMITELETRRVDEIYVREKFLRRW